MTLIDKAEALLPCPFCGGEASLHKGMQAFDDYEVHCDECGVCGPNFGAMDETFSPRDDAIAAWNRRALPARGLPSVDELSSIIRMVDGQNSLGAGALAEAILAALKGAGNE